LCPGRRFALKVEKIYEAIDCESESGPNFRDFYCDVGISDNCNTNDKSLTINCDSCYTNDTGLEWKSAFTGSQYLVVKEIEVFEFSRSQTQQDFQDNLLCLGVWNCKNCEKENLKNKQFNLEDDPLAVYEKSKYQKKRSSC
jgi:succinate dehydrogenase/fumarate reductase-like Fe-S protein